MFIDSVDEEGNISERAVDKAVNAAKSLQTVIDFSLNKYLKSNVNGKVIECGIGIDYGKVLVTWVGMCEKLYSEMDMAFCLVWRFKIVKIYR